MKTLLESEEFRAELPGWILRGVFCAANSACWATLAGFTHPAEIAGMVVGVAFWVAVFAGFCGWARQTGRIATGRMAEALKTAAWIKLLLVLLGLPAMFGRGLLPEWMYAFVFGISMDMVLGMLSLAAVGWIAGLKNLEEVAGLDSAAWTALATATEGALMAVLITIIATLVLAWRRFVVGRIYSPVRNPD